MHWMGLSNALEWDLECLDGTRMHWMRPIQCIGVGLECIGWGIECIGVGSRMLGWDPRF